MNSPAANAALLHLTPDPTGVVLARWVPATTAAPETYPSTLAAASYYGHSRFWLFDLRDQPIPTADPGRWLADAFALRAFCAPGQPVYVAYVLNSPFRASLERAAIAAARRAGDTYDVHPRCFGTLASARAWLARQGAGAAHD